MIDTCIIIIEGTVIKSKNYEIRLCSITGKNEQIFINARLAPGVTSPPVGMRIRAFGSYELNKNFAFPDLVLHRTKMIGAKEAVFINPETGETGRYASWEYEKETGVIVNAVDRG